MPDTLRTQLEHGLAPSYRIERELGGGGMSRVFVARDLTLSRDIVVKVLAPDLAAGVSGERFKREIQIAAQLQHPHVVPVLASGAHEALLYYTMPFVAGESLRQRLAREGALPVKEALQIWRDVLDALAHAHARGVVHRDIKPENILLEGRHALVADFGIARAVQAATDAGRATATGLVIGTPAYMAPEQAAGERWVDHRADLYSAALVMYEMLVAHPPFSGLSPRELLLAHLTQEAPPLPSDNVPWPPTLATLVMRCLSKEPAERPQSAEVILAELDGAMTPLAFSAPEWASITALGSKRAIGRALAIYAGAFGLTAIAARVAMIRLGLPDWVFPGALMVMALGLPVILFTGFVLYQARRARALPTYTPRGSPRPLLARASLRAGRHLNWRRTVVLGAATMLAFVAIVSLYMGARALGIGPAATLLSAGVVERRGQVLIGDFAAQRADTAIASVVTEALRTDLKQSRVVRLVEPGAVRAALERMKRAPGAAITGEVAHELATREGIRLVIEGDVRRAGGGYLLTTRLVAPAGPEVLDAFREEAADSSQVIGAIDRLSRRVRAKIGESLKSVRAAPSLEHVTTASFGALEKYTQAMRALNRDHDSQRGMQLLREAFALDTTFAMAYAQLCCLAPGIEAIEAANQAFRHRDRLPPLERHQVELFYYVNANEPENIVTAGKSVLELDSTNWRALHDLGLAYGRMREFKTAEQYLQRAAAVDSIPAFVTLFALRRVQYALGEREGARQTLSRIRRLNPNAGAGLEINYLVAEGELDEAERRMRARLAEAAPGPRQLPLLNQLRNLVLLRGQIRESEQLRERAVGLLVQQGQRVGALGWELDGAWVQLRLLADSVLARRRLAESLTRYPLDSIPPLDRPYLSVARLEASLGNLRRAADLLGEYERVALPILGQRGDRVEFNVTRAVLAWQQGKYRSAVAFAREADQGPCTICALHPLGYAYDRAASVDSAVAVYERYVTTPTLDRGNPDPALALTHERLGQLYEERGNRSKAIEHYRAFVELWKAADPALQPRVSAARAAIARLLL